MNYSMGTCYTILRNYQTDIDLLMADCTSTEKRYIFEVLSAIKNILRINDWHLSSKHNYDADNPNDY